jgi:hypothetical protein
LSRALVLNGTPSRHRVRAPWLDRNRGDGHPACVEVQSLIFWLQFSGLSLQLLAAISAALALPRFRAPREWAARRLLEIATLFHLILLLAFPATLLTLIVWGILGATSSGSVPSVSDRWDITLVLLLEIAWSGFYALLAMMILIMHVLYVLTDINSRPPSLRPIRDLWPEAGALLVVSIGVTVAVAAINAVGQLWSLSWWVLAANVSVPLPLFLALGFEAAGHLTDEQRRDLLVVCASLFAMGVGLELAALMSNGE